MELGVGRFVWDADRENANIAKHDVDFTYRRGQVRIFGAGYWRKGKTHYEEE